MKKFSQVLVTIILGISLVSCQGAFVFLVDAVSTIIVIAFVIGVILAIIGSIG